MGLNPDMVLNQDMVRNEMCCKDRRKKVNGVLNRDFVRAERPRAAGR